MGHDLNLVPVLSLMASSLPSDAADKLADLRSRMRAARFDSEPEIMELSMGIEDWGSAAQQGEGHRGSGRGVADTLAQAPNLGSGSGNSSSAGAGTGGGTPPGKGNEEVEALKSEVQRDLRQAEKQERWTEVGKLMDLNTFLGLASLSQEPPIVHANSRLALRVQAQSPELQVSEEFKCRLSGEVMKDPECSWSRGRRSTAAPSRRGSPAASARAPRPRPSSAASTLSPTRELRRKIGGRLTSGSTNAPSRRPCASSGTPRGHTPRGSPQL